MDTLNPDLRAAIIRLPGGFADCQKQSIDRYQNLQKEIKELHLKLDSATEVNLTNGDGLKIKTADIIPKMHKDLREIKEATEFLVDFSKLHNIFKKYYIYWIVTVTFTGWQIGSPIFTIIKELVKHL